MRRKQLFLTVSFLAGMFSCWAQTAVLLQQQADSLYNLKQYGEAGKWFAKEAAAQKLVPFKKQAYINAAYSYAQNGDIDSGITQLKHAVYNCGFKNKGFLESDEVMLRLKPHAAFADMIQYISSQDERIKNPANAQIFTGDIDLFWKAYDHFLKDTAHAENIFMQEYIEQGSPALQDYYRIKIRRIKSFTDNIKRMPLFLAGIRKNSLSIQQQDDRFRQIYQHLKELYPPAKFPALNFVIGMFHSGGTVNDYGAVSGADMQCADSLTNNSELTAWEKDNLHNISGIQYVVAHETIHNQQDHLAEDTTLLRAVLVEGMADFIGELISGNNSNPHLHVWAKGKEAQLWLRFKKEMYLNRGSYWIANRDNAPAGEPADLGYWIGYQICKAYYNNTADKKQAVYDILNIKDYKSFYEKSGVEKLYLP